MDLKMRLPRTEGVFVRTENTGAPGREVRGMQPEQGTPRVTGSHQRPGDQHRGGSPPKPTDTSISDFWPPEGGKEHVPVAFSHPGFGHLLWQPQDP